MFKGQDTDGADIFDTKEEAIERAKQIIQYQGEPGDKIMVHRTSCPLWIAHLFQGTRFEWIGYQQII